MRHSKEARLVTIIFLSFHLLSLTSLSIISVAENVPLSQEGIDKIGLNKIRLENGIGVMVFNLSKESGDTLRGKGFLTLSNTTICRG